MEEVSKYLNSPLVIVLAVILWEVLKKMLNMFQASAEKNREKLGEIEGEVSHLSKKVDFIEKNYISQSDLRNFEKQIVADIKIEIKEEVGRLYQLVDEILSDMKSITKTNLAMELKCLHCPSANTNMNKK